MPRPEPALLRVHECCSEGDASTVRRGLDFCAPLCLVEKRPY